MSKTLGELRRIAAEKYNAPMHAEKWRNNGLKWTERRKTGTVFHYMLHETEVAQVTVPLDGPLFIVLNTGGFQTRTTRAAMSELLMDWAIRGGVGSGGKKSPNKIYIADAESAFAFDTEMWLTRDMPSLGRPPIFTVWTDLQAHATTVHALT